MMRRPLSLTMLLWLLLLVQLPFCASAHANQGLSGCPHDASACAVTPTSGTVARTIKQMHNGCLADGTNCHDFYASDYIPANATPAQTWAGITSALAAAC